MLDKVKKEHRYLTGFTLLEILIVLLIIGIISSIAVVSFGDFGGSRRINVFAEDFLSYLKLVQNQAIIESNAVGIQINSSTFQTYRLNDEFKWQPASSALFAAPAFPKQMSVKLISNLKTKINSPDIIIDNSGEITPFQLYLGTSKNPKQITLINDNAGGLKLSKYTSPPSN